MPLFPRYTRDDYYLKTKGSVKEKIIYHLLKMVIFKGGYFNGALVGEKYLTQSDSNKDKWGCIAELLGMGQ